MTSENSEDVRSWNALYGAWAKPKRLPELGDVPALDGAETSALAGPLSICFWGLDLDGAPLPGLNEVLTVVENYGDGHREGQKTEFDALLVGPSDLVCIEAKNSAGFGTCSRFQRSQCPEIHYKTRKREYCHYWDRRRPATIEKCLEGLTKPGPGSRPPGCHRLYQLMRNVVVGTALADAVEKRLHFWVAIPEGRWNEISPYWTRFMALARNPGLRARCRALGWETLERSLASGYEDRWILRAGRGPTGARALRGGPCQRSLGRWREDST